MRVPSARFRRSAVGAALLALIAPLSVGCNRADGYADEFSAYLRDQPAVESFSVRPNNAVLSAGSVDSTVRLRAGMSDDEVAQTIRTIASHNVGGGAGVTSRIRVSFPSVNGATAAADVTVIVIPGSENPRTGDPSTVLGWVQRTRALVAADSSITALDLWSDSIHADTTAAAYPLAERLDRFVAMRPDGLVRLAVSGGDCHLQWDAGDRLDALAPYRDLLAALPPDRQPVHCRASSQTPLTEPSFFLTLPRGTEPTVLAAVQDLAARLGLAAKITIGA
ncbi:hypothetical protein [Gordonia phthalatica]|uniref:Uncharacterized protein n=1 Tax=Gordonia phthalatica TaxID=1136941 RepID=A0A0N9MPN1_9ACTN|nr:hypothetical protein [Gordonia phthalatica]ALG84757.1 hypothetical protein ACH46_09945 [Gordonia phthalatica]